MKRSSWLSQIRWFLTMPDSLERLVLTRNCNDFNDLHGQNPSHPGILAIYEGAEPSKNLNYATIVKCIANLEASGYNLTNQFISLNYWNY